MLRNRLINAEAPGLDAGRPRLGEVYGAATRTTPQIAHRLGRCCGRRFGHRCVARACDSEGAGLCFRSHRRPQPRGRRAGRRGGGVHTIIGNSRRDLPEPMPIAGVLLVPTGGDHDAATQNCGVHDAPAGTWTAVHSFEHGAVWITYAPGIPADDMWPNLRAWRPATITCSSAPFQTSRLLLPSGEASRPTRVANLPSATRVWVERCYRRACGKPMTAWAVKGEAPYPKTRTLARDARDSVEPIDGLPLMLIDVRRVPGFGMVYDVPCCPHSDEPQRDFF